MADYLKEFEETVMDYLHTTDTSALARNLLQHGLISLTNFEFLFNELSHDVSHPQLHRYLLSNAHQHLQADPALFDRYLEVLAKHSVSSVTLEQLRNKYTSSMSMALTPGIGKSTESDSVEGGTKRTITRNLFREEHISKLTEILAGYASKWDLIGISLNLLSDELSCIYRSCHFDLVLCLNKVLHGWVLQQHQYAKPPTLESLKETLCSNMVKLGDVASDLEQKLMEHGVHLAGEEPLPPKKRQCLDYVPIVGESVQPSNESELSHSPATHKGSQITMWRKTLTDVYSAQPEVPEDSWPPVSNETYINLALVKQGDIKISNEYARCTIQGDMDDILKDKESIEYENVFNDLESGARLLIEGRPGSGKTTLVHKVSRDWANGQLKLNGVQLLFLIHLRHFLSDANITLHDIIKSHYPEQSTVNQIVKFAEEHSGEGLCFILDGLDEYNPKKNNTTVFKLIRKQILPKAVLIVASRPSASAGFRKIATKQVETLGFLKDEIIKYVRIYKFDGTDKSDGLLSYLQLHPNVMHMCYLPIHTAMVCFLYDKMGSTLPRTETEIYDKFTNQTILRALSRDESASADVYLESVEDLPVEEKKFFTQICKLAFQKTTKSQQVMKSSEVKHFFSNVTSGKESLGLITVDNMAMLCGMEKLYTFLHLTFQEYLAAYYIAHLSEGEQIKQVEKLGKKRHMQVVWKFYCGLIKFNNQASKFDKLMKSASDDLFRVQCAFESQQHVTCDYVVKSSGDSGCLSFRSTFLNPTDFTAIGYVISSAAHPVEKLDMNRCKFGQEGVNALLKETGDKIFSLKSFGFHGGNCNREQVTVVNALLKNTIAHLEALDITDTKFGIEKIKDLTKELKLPNLQIITVSDNQCNTKVLKPLSKICSSSKFQSVEVVPFRLSRPLSHSVQTSIIETFGLLVLFHSIGQFWCINLQGQELGCPDIEVLSANLMKYSQCTELLLSNCNLGDQEATVLSKTLKDFPKLRLFNVSFNCIGDEGAKALAEGLKHCTDLSKLDLSCNEIGDVGAVAVAQVTSLINFKCFIWNPKITEIGVTRLKKIGNFRTIDYSGVEIENDRIAPFISKKTSFYTNLSTLTINVTSNEVIPFDVILKCCSNLHSFHLDAGQIILSGVIYNDPEAALAKNLKHCSNLYSLHLDQITIGSDGAKALAESLKHWSNLHTLHLRRNKIGVDGAKALIESLKHCNNLHTLYIGLNTIGDDNAKALVEILQRCSNLHTLDLNGNEIGANGAKALAESIKHWNNLQTLNLQRNRIGDDGAKALAGSLKHCQDLRTLIWFENNIGDDGAKALAKSLRHCHKLHMLKLSGNKFGDAGKKALTEHLKQCRTLHIN